jgi:hypothetical protein
VIEFQGGDGLVFAARRDVASLVPEFDGRWRGVLRDGTVAHRPVAPGEGPWVAVGDMLLNPRWLVRTENGWEDPAGFVFASGELDVVPEPEEPAVAGLPCAADAVYALRPDGATGCAWLTDNGEFVWPKTSARKASALHPRMVEITKSLYVNRRRLRRIGYCRARLRGVLDNGLEFRINVKAGVLAARLGLASISRLEPYRAALYRDVELRDWPYRLALAPGETLQRDFPTRRKLIANLLWQRFRQGWTKQSAFRQLWYEDVAPAVERAGFARAGGYAVLQELLRTWVGDERFFTFREYGFKDPGAHNRRIGSDVVLVVEKDTIADRAFALAREFGVSCIVLSGQPSLLETEWFVHVLARKLVRVIALVDYDPAGWIVARSFVAQLRRYGVEVPRPVEFLVRPEVFTAAELELVAVPISAGSASWEEKTQDWMAECGGVNGERLAVGADHLEPYARLRERFRAVLQSFRGD